MLHPDEKAGWKNRGLRDRGRLYEVKDVFETLDDTGTTYDEAKTALNAHFQPQVNVTYQRHLFRKSSQTDTETVSQFVVRLKQQQQQNKNKNETCQYSEETNNVIRFQVVDKCRCLSLRKTLYTQNEISRLPVYWNLHRQRKQARYKQQALPIQTEPLLSVTNQSQRDMLILILHQQVFIALWSVPWQYRSKAPPHSQSVQQVWATQPYIRQLSLYRRQNLSQLWKQGNFASMCWSKHTNTSTPPARLKWSTVQIQNLKRELMKSMWFIPLALTHLMMSKQRSKSLAFPSKCWLTPAQRAIFSVQPTMPNWSEMARQHKSAIALFVRITHLPSRFNNVWPHRSTTAKPWYQRHFWFCPIHAPSPHC